MTAASATARSPSISATAAAIRDSVSPTPPNQWTNAAVSGGTPRSNQTAIGLFTPR
jgi:hypothetical protein